MYKMYLRPWIIEITNPFSCNIPQGSQHRMIATDWKFLKLLHLLTQFSLFLRETFHDMLSMFIIGPYAIYFATGLSVHLTVYCQTMSEVSYDSTFTKVTSYCLDYFSFIVNFCSSSSILCQLFCIFCINQVSKN